MACAFLVGDTGDEGDEFEIDAIREDKKRVFGKAVRVLATRLKYAYILIK
jgi:hypothetical protein